MGGALTLLMSTRLDVIAAVAMSAPYKLPDDPRLRHIDLISQTVPFMPKGDNTPGAGWFDKEAWQGHISYPQNPVRSIGQLNKLLAEMRAALPELHIPVLLLHSQDDDYVLPGNMELIFTDLINTTDKTKIYITGSGHVITRDAARQQVFAHVLEFIHRIGSPKESI
jgi:carboxylesterase